MFSGALYRGRSVPSKKPDNYLHQRKQSDPEAGPKSGQQNIDQTLPQRSRTTRASSFARAGQIHTVLSTVSVRGPQHLRIDCSGVDGLGINGGSERNGLAGGSRVRVGLVVQEDEGEARGGNGYGASVGGSVARNVHDVQFALETTVGFEVGAEILAGPSKVTLDGDVIGEEIFDPDGGRRTSGLAGLTTADGDGDTQVVSARFIVQVVEEGDLHGGTILVDGIAGG